MSITALLFLFTAFIYASVGFGGGSSYTALLVFFETPYLLIPILSLLCNIIVVAGGTWRFNSDQLIPWRKIWPLFATSVPMAWIGGTLPINESTFELLLAITLSAAALVMLLEPKSAQNTNSSSGGFKWTIPLVGAILGLIAGMVGIGGGIFLAPVLHFLKWETSKVIAGVCSSFILINSIAGLTGQFSKFGSVIEPTTLSNYWPLFAAVLIGGQLGSIMGTRKLNAEKIKMITALLVLFVAARLLVNNWIAR